MANTVTIIYYTYNNKEKMETTIDSIRKQQYKDWNLVIINDASNNETRGEISRLLEVEQKNNIQVIHNDTFLGREKSINTIVSKVKAKYLAFIEDGAVWEKYKLMVQVQMLEEFEKNFPNKKVGLCYGCAKIDAGKYLPPKNIKMEILQDKIFPILLMNELIDFSSVVIKSEVWKALGGLTEELSTFSEREFFVRLSLEYKILFEDIVVVNKEQFALQATEKEKADSLYYMLEQYLEYYKVFDKVEVVLKKILQHCLSFGGYQYYTEMFDRLERAEKVARVAEEKKVVIKIQEIEYQVSKYIASVITELQYIVVLVNENKWLVASNRYDKVLSRLCYLNVILNYFGEELVEFEDDLKLIAEYADVIVAGDMITGSIIPKLEKCASLFYPQGFADDTYSIEPTASGYYTLSIKQKYLHGNDNPMMQAYYLAKYYFDTNRGEYNIFGAGLGYVCYQLYQISNYTAKINLYEPDTNVIQFGYEYGVFGDIPTENFTVTHDPTGEQFLTRILDNTEGSIMDQRTVNMMEEGGCKEALIGLLVNYNTNRSLSHDIEINRRILQELSSIDYNIDDFFAHADQKEMIIVAAGPTLDFNLEWIREQQGKKTIIAVTTVAKKLLEADITPDYLAVLDPQERTYGHMKGIENITIPMIIGYGAYWKFATNYKGKRYLTKYKDSARGYMYTGETVTNLAIQLAIEAKATKIYLAGVDLAFVGGMSHASNTMDLKKEAKEGPIMVEAVGGGKVATSQAFKSYLSQVEQQVANAPDITFINLSKGGARIKGTQEGL